MFLWCHFNTSHVTVYHHAGVGSWFRSQISIHPMLRFIIMYVCSKLSECFISIHPMLRFIISATDGTLFFKNFNTSHVTVYLHWCTEHKPCFFIFQYIPCYGLSSNTSCGSIALTDFNTSHVTVYLGCNLSAGIFLSDFNTSHVTVYPTWSAEVKGRRTNFNTSHVTVYRRQPLNRFRPVRHFNTSHVTVYQYKLNT